MKRVRFRAHQFSEDGLFTRVAWMFRERFACLTDCSSRIPSFLEERQSILRELRESSTGGKKEALRKPLRSGARSTSGKTQFNFHHLFVQIGVGFRSISFRIGGVPLLTIKQSEFYLEQALRWGRGRWRGRTSQYQVVTLGVPA